MTFRLTSSAALGRVASSRILGARSARFGVSTASAERQFPGARCDGGLGASLADDMDRIIWNLTGQVGDGTVSGLRPSRPRAPVPRNEVPAPRISRGHPGRSERPERVPVFVLRARCRFTNGGPTVLVLLKELVMSVPTRRRRGTCAVFAVVLSLGLVSCSSDSSDGSPGGDPPLSSPSLGRTARRSSTSSNRR